MTGSREIPDGRGTEGMDIVIRPLSPELEEAYLDFFDHRAFSDGSPYYPCYCNAFNMSAAGIEGMRRQAKNCGGSTEGWKRVLRETASRMVKDGSIRGYLAFADGLAVGWCNANDRTSYYRVGEFDLDNVPEDRPPDCTRSGQVKSVVCFEICPEYRGRGIASLLLERVCADAEADGYGCVEAYPADRPQTSPAFTGPVRLYEKAGFTVYSRTGHTLIMRKTLPGRGGSNLYIHSKELTERIREISRETEMLTDGLVSFEESVAVPCFGQIVLRFTLKGEYCTAEYLDRYEALLYHIAGDDFLCDFMGSVYRKAGADYTGLEQRLISMSERFGDEAVIPSSHADGISRDAAALLQAAGLETDRPVWEIQAEDGGYTLLLMGKEDRHVLSVSDPVRLTVREADARACTGLMKGSLYCRRNHISLIRLLTDR